MATNHFSGPLVVGDNETASTLATTTGIEIVAGDLQLDSGNLVINGATLSATELGYLDGITPGTAAASKALVLNSSSGITTGLVSLVATTTTATTGNITTANVTDLLVGATPVHQVDPASCTIVAVAGAANHSTITVTLKDGAGTTLTRVHPFKVYLATDSTGLTLQSAASTGYSVASGGVKDPTGSTTITQGLAALSSASGACVIDLLDTGKGTGNLILVLHNGIKASAAITSGSYG